MPAKKGYMQFAARSSVSLASPSPTNDESSEHGGGSVHHYRNESNTNPTAVSPSPAPSPPRDEGSTPYKTQQENTNERLLPPLPPPPPLPPSHAHQHQRRHSYASSSVASATPQPPTTRFSSSVSPREEPSPPAAAAAAGSTGSSAVINHTNTSTPPKASTTITRADLDGKGGMGERTSPLTQGTPNPKLPKTSSPSTTTTTIMNQNDPPVNSSSSTNQRQFPRDERSYAPDGRPWIQIFGENCTSETARTKGINKRSLFYCITVKNPFRSELKELVVDEEFLVFREEEPPTANEAVVAAVTDALNPNAAPQAAAAAVATSTTTTTVTTVTSTGVVLKAAAAIKNVTPAKAFLLDEDLVRPRDVNSAEDKAQQLRQKRREEWREANALRSIDLKTSTNFQSQQVLSASASSLSPLSPATPSGDPALVEKDAPRPIPNDFQKIIELLWRLTQRGIDVYPTSMLRPYRTPEEREEMKRTGQWECPYEAMYRMEREAEAAEKRRETKKKKEKEEEKKKKKSNKPEREAEKSHHAILDVDVDVDDPEDDSTRNKNSGDKTRPRDRSVSSSSSTDKNKKNNKKDDDDYLLRHYDKSTVAGPGEIDYMHDETGGGSEPLLSNPYHQQQEDEGATGQDSPRLTREILDKRDQQKDEYQKKSPAELAKCAKKSAAIEKKQAQEKAKAIKELQERYPNLSNYEANRFHGMMLSEEDCYLSPDKDEIYIKIHARTDKLIEFAETHSLPLISHEYSPGGGAAIACTTGINARYSARVKKFAETIGMPPEMYSKNGAFHFDTPHKMRMMDRLLREPWAYGGCGLQINEMIGKEIVITSFFPLHNQTALVETGLLEWASFKPLFSLAPLDQDENAIVSYFGEEIALYFYWIQEMTFFLRWLAIPGMITGVFSAIDFYKDVASASFALCCVVWGGLWCLWWARKEKEFAVLYCQEEQSAQEGVRDEFVGKEEKLSISDVYELRFSHPLSIRLRKESDGTVTVTNTIDDYKRRQRIRYFISYPTISVIVLVMIAVMIIITWWRFENIGNDYVSYSSSILTTVVSAAFGAVFGKATEILNEMENLRTHNDVVVQNIQKSFLFSFFSSYFSLFIIALYPLSKETDAARLRQLESQMIIICLVNPMVQNITETLLPNFNLRWRLETDLHDGSKIKGIFAALKMFDVFSKHAEEKELLEREREQLKRTAKIDKLLREQRMLNQEQNGGVGDEGLKSVSVAAETTSQGKTRRSMSVGTAPGGTDSKTTERSAGTVTFLPIAENTDGLLSGGKTSGSKVKRSQSYSNNITTSNKNTTSSNNKSTANENNIGVVSESRTTNQGIGRHHRTTSYGNDGTQSVYSQKSVATDAARTGNADQKLLLHRYFCKIEETRENARRALKYAENLRKQQNKSSSPHSPMNLSQNVDGGGGGSEASPISAESPDFTMRTLPEHLSWYDERAELWFQAQLEPMEGTYGDYLEITLQFGFMAMCAASFPWAAVAALFYNLLELRFDAIKRVHFSRRPMCRTAVNIGPWRAIFVIITIIAVVTNSYLVFVIGDTMDEMDLADNELAKWKAFIIMQYLAVFVILSAVGMIGTTPTSAAKVTAKREAVANKAFQRASDQATRTRREIEAMERALRREEREKIEDKRRREERRKREAEAAKKREVQEKAEKHRQAALLAAAEEYRRRGIPTSAAGTTTKAQL